MEIFLNGQSAFFVKTSSGSVICDPANSNERAFIASSAADDAEVSALLYSTPVKSALAHTRDSIGMPTVITRAGEYEIGDLGLKGIALNASDDPSQRRMVTSYRINAENLAVYMLGLPGVPPDTRTVQMIGHVDVLLVDASRLKLDPKGLSSTIGSLEPALVIANGLDAESGEPGSTLKALLGELGGESNSAEPQTRVTISKSSLPEDRQLVVLKAR